MIEKEGMPSESASDVKLEIGHVLFIDIVGYSKLLIHEQTGQLQNFGKSRAPPTNSVPHKRKVNCCAYQPGTAVRWFFAIVRKSLFYVHCKSVRR
jgi:hypothetical protein